MKRQLLVTLLVALTLVGCQANPKPNNVNDTEPPISTKTNLTDSVDKQAEMQELTIRLTENSIETSPKTVKPEMTKITVVNNGRLYNELRIVGNGVNTSVENGLFPEENKTLTLNLTQGTYQLYSPIPGKREEGFDADLRVG